MTLTKEKKILIAMIALYIIIFGVISSLRQYNFQTQTWDMGAFVQTFWNTTQGKIMFNNLEDAPNHLGVHMSPWLFILVPGYALFQSPYYLLIIQTIALGLGAWPLFLLARKILGSAKWALLIAGGYLLYPSLHWVNLFDFHAVSFFIPLMFAAFYFLEIEKWGWAGIFLILSASTKENAILAVMMAGIWLLIRKRFGRFPGQDKALSKNERQEIKPSGTSWWTKERKIGIAVAILALIYFIISVQVIMPALGGGLLRLDRYVDLGTNPGEILQTMITQPQVVIQTIFNTPKMLYLLWIFLPVLFIPFLSWRTLLLVAPGIAQNLLTSFEFQFTSFFQYDSIIIPGVWLGAIYGVYVFLHKFKSREKIIFASLLAAILIMFSLRSPISFLHFPTALFETDNKHWEAYRAMIQVVPDGVSIAAQTNLIPHLSHREHAYMLGREPEQQDMVLIDAGDAFGFSSRESFEAYLDSYTTSENYEVELFLDNRYLVMKKKNK